MLARLLQWFQPKAAPRRPAPSNAPPGSVAPRTRATPPPAPPAELFLDQLARETPLPEPLTPADEAHVSAVVLQVVDYLSQKRVEPPIMPALVPRVLSLVNAPEVDMARLARLIEQDVAIGAKLLSIANSAAFGGQREITSVRDAIAHLGTEQVAQIAIGLAARTSYEATKGDQTAAMRARWGRLFHHAMTCAFAAAHAASQRDREQQEAAFLGGLFHDVGKAVALRALEAIAASGRLAPTSDLLIDEALHRVHAYPGDEFFDKWTLPASLMTICAHHHQLEDLDESVPLLHFVALISGFDALLAGGPAEQRSALSEVRFSADQLALSEADLRALHTQTRAFGERAKRMFKAA